MPGGLTGLIVNAALLLLWLSHSMIFTIFRYMTLGCKFSLSDSLSYMPTSVIHGYCHEQVLLSGDCCIADFRYVGEESLPGSAEPLAGPEERIVSEAAPGSKCPGGVCEREPVLAA